MLGDGLDVFAASVILARHNLKSPQRNLSKSASNMKVTIAAAFCLASVGAQGLVSEKKPAPTELEPADLIPQDCSCRSDHDCQQSWYCPNQCVFEKFSFGFGTGTCKHPVKTRSPTKSPTPSPTKAPTEQCTCNSDYDCLRSRYCPNKCVFKPYTRVGTCEEKSPPTKAPTKEPTGGGGGCCHKPRSIPTECEVEVLIKLMETAALKNIAIMAQWLRLSFHDAGTFDQAVPEGGANGCLLTHPPMRTQPENANLDLALNTLQTVKDSWETNPFTCLDVSAADVIQFAGWFSVIRQRGLPGLNQKKIVELIDTFRWGRLDEQACDIEWTENLPGFALGTDENDIEARCLFAGGEVKEKMMDRNGFTAEEATALIGAHTIGLTRNVFGSSLAAPWVANGADDATPQGPVFDNTFHDFLENTITANTAAQFANNQHPFDVPFPNWFQDSVNELNHLDTDIALAFPSQNLAIHPHFDTFTALFASDNEVFVIAFMEAFDKMSSLGVNNRLTHALSCQVGCGTGKGPISRKDTLALEAELDDAIDDAGKTIQETNNERAAEISALTTPVAGEFEI